MDFEYIKGNDSVLAVSLSRLKTLGLYEANDPEELGSEYGKSIFDSELDMVCDINISQSSNRAFEIKGVIYLIDEKDLDDIPSESVDAHSKDPNPQPFKCNLDMTKVK